MITRIARRMTAKKKSVKKKRNQKKKSLSRKKMQSNFKCNSNIHLNINSYLVTQMVNKETGDGLLLTKRKLSLLQLYSRA